MRDHEGRPLDRGPITPDEIADLEIESGFAAAEQRREMAIDLCPKCGYPIVLCSDGRWRHDQLGDAMACGLFYGDPASPRAE